MPSAYIEFILCTKYKDLINNPEITIHSYYALGGERRNSPISQTKFKININMYE